MTGLSSKYQVVFLGHTDDRADQISGAISERLVELGISTEAVSYLSEIGASRRKPDLPVVCYFFGYEGALDNNHPELAALIDESRIVIPVVADLEGVHNKLPESLETINALEVTPEGKNIERAASLALEAFRLIRRERRLFISYRRKEALAMANQLYDALDARGFDVFIDTRSVPPAADFQGELWHRLADTDVVVLIDTPGFRSSRWTVEELARANLTNIQILHLLWPGQSEDPESALSYFYPLEVENFVSLSSDASSRLTDETVESICNEAEALRARAIAARYRYLVDAFCDAARDLGFSPTVQPDRWISVRLPGDRELAVVPTLGIPTSHRMNDVFSSISAQRHHKEGIWVLYDNRGILQTWLDHLEWLDGYLPLRSVKAGSSYQALRGLRR